MFYHVRHRNGVTVDWLRSRDKALSLAHVENLLCYEVNGETGTARLIAAHG